VIEQTGAQDATLVGFSMGGGEVARCVSRHAGKGVAKAALVSTVVPFMLKTADNPEGTAPSVFDAMTKGMTEDRARFFGSFFKDFFGIGVLSHAVSDERLQWARNVSMQAGLNATLGCARSFATTDFRPDMTAFKVPTLIIHGTDDKTVPIAAAGRAAAKGIAGSTLIEYEDAPHGLFATHKARLTKDLLTLLREQPSSSGALRTGPKALVPTKGPMPLILWRCQTSQHVQPWLPLPWGRPFFWARARRQARLPSATARHWHARCPATASIPSVRAAWPR